jgi:SRSO17 transposase
MSKNNKINVYNPEYWGINKEKVNQLSDELNNIIDRFEDCFKTKTHNKKEYAYVYTHGLLCIKGKKTIANICREAGDKELFNYQNLHHFISNTNWNGKKIFKLIQEEIKKNDQLKDGILTLDESGIRKYGCKTAGVNRQWIGNIGKVENGQVSVGLGYYKDNFWSLVDTELYLPEVWFNEEKKILWNKLNIPKDRKFKTKIQIGLEMIINAYNNNLPFNIVCCDSLYGRDSLFRSSLDYLGIKYMAEIPCDTVIFTSKPYVWLSNGNSDEERQLSLFPELSNSFIKVNKAHKLSDFKKHKIRVRDCERGILYYDCFCKKVWTINSDGYLMKELFFLVDEGGGKFRYYLSNLEDNTSLEDLAFYSSGRYFVERVYEDIKGDIGWDNLQAQKYTSWEHHTSLCALCLWLFNIIKLSLFTKSSYDDRLLSNFKIYSAPSLSIGNFRELLLSVLPLNELTVIKAINNVVNKLVNRSRVTSCLLRKQLVKGFDET